MHVLIHFQLSMNKNSFNFLILREYATQRPSSVEMSQIKMSDMIGNFFFPEWCVTLNNSYLHHLYHTLLSSLQRQSAFEKIILLVKGESTGIFIVQLKELIHRDESLLLCVFSPSSPMLPAYMITWWSNLIRVVVTTSF